jgi:hypothetical protein
MSMIFGKSPPRFVPTLTEVVRPVEAKAPGPAALPEPVAPASAATPASLPPGFAELLQGWPAGLGLSAAQPPAPDQPAELGAATTSSAPSAIRVSAELQQVIVDRILQIVEDSVEHRVRQALELVLAPQLQSLAAAVRAEVAEAVRQAVGDTLAAEFKDQRDSTEV